MVAAVNHILCNSYLLQILLTRVCMVGINYCGGVYKGCFGIQLMQLYKVLIVVIGNVFARKINVSAQNGVSIRITLAYNLPTAVYKGVAVLRGGY